MYEEHTAPVSSGTFAHATTSVTSGETSVVAASVSTVAPTISTTVPTSVTLPTHCHCRLFLVSSDGCITLFARGQEQFDVSVFKETGRAGTIRCIRVQRDSSSKRKPGCTSN